MSFYVTLPSNGSQHVFPDNKPRRFTNQLPERLIFQEQDWEVALASISLPYSQVYLDPTKLGTRILEENVVNDHVVTTDELLAERPITDGISMANTLVDLLRKKKMTSPTLVQFEDANGMYQRWVYRWFLRGNDRILLLDASNIDNQYEANKSNYIAFNITFAERFHMIKRVNATLKWTPDERTQQLGFDHYYTDENNVEQFFELDYGLIPSAKDPKGKNLKGRRIRNSELWWQVVSNKDKKLGKYDEPQLRLWPDCNWIWCGIEQYFREVFGSPTRTLYVHTDAGQTQMVGNTTTDVLRAFTYTHRGEGQDYFEPRQLQFVPIRKNVMDTISVSVRDASGQEVQFVGDHPLIVTLKFERRSARL